MFVTTFMSQHTQASPSQIKDMVGLLVGQQASDRCALYRLDQDRTLSCLTVLTQDPVINSNTSIWNSHESGSYDLSPAKEGDRLNFQIRVNLSYCESETKKRKDWVRAYQSQQGLPSAQEAAIPAAEAWFAKRDLGFTVKVAQAKYAFVEFKHKGNTVSFPAYDLEGTLVITDPLKFRNAVAKGIGREKAFGCGLLLTWPA